MALAQPKHNQRGKRIAEGKLRRVGPAMAHCQHSVALMICKQITAATRRMQAFNDGGAYRDRTDDPLLAKQVLSQLS